VITTRETFMPRKKAQEPEVPAPREEKRGVASLPAANLGREDLDALWAKVNEIIDHLNA
jgi:hypothetical protein